ncbi:MAG TPA: aldehyde ferredoxin oxidoreductase N-terminal domain-containing protein, partial [Thermoproteota archaeon]|nr:aldehyde ferredoxin oxidoreductase N-terminal domain-containing protein [Thermoproteota archaeon]
MSEGMAGWMGRIAEVDLADSNVRFLQHDEDTMHRFIGGRGLGAKIVYDSVKPGTDPLEPANVLVFAVGPLTGTAAPTSGRYVVSTKSPLTGTMFDANGGGFYGPKFKGCGIDALVVKNAAKSPVIIQMDNKGIQVLDGEKYWGKGVFDTTRQLTERFG